MDDLLPQKDVCHRCSMPIEQACAVPYRNQGGRLQFCLITSTRGRWIFPKGFIDPGENAEETARKEAFEEAGLHGQILSAPLGCYCAAKDCHELTVTALLMHVCQVDDTWAEAEMRQRRWVDADGAQDLLEEPALLDLLRVALSRIGQQ